MYKPPKDVALKTYAPTNPEYGLVDLMVSEAFAAVSPEIYYWSFDAETTEQDMDEVDQMYGEKSSGDAVRDFTGPYQIDARIDFNPILKEITRLGMEQKEDIDIFVNIATVYEQLKKRVPKSGDIMRVSYIGRDPNDAHPANSKPVTYYSVSVVTPYDLYNNRYTNLQIYAIQTPLNDIPDKIKNCTF